MKGGNSKEDENEVSTLGCPKDPKTRIYLSVYY